MIVCSCNVFSDQQLRYTLAKATQRLRVSQIYDRLGSSVQCGRCAYTIKRIMEQITGCAESASRKRAGGRTALHKNQQAVRPDPLAH
jgi:bacterioferritin-associated ferredoxin